MREFVNARSALQRPPRFLQPSELLTCLSSTVEQARSRQHPKKNNQKPTPQLDTTPQLDRGEHRRIKANVQKLSVYFHEINHHSKIWRWKQFCLRPPTRHRCQLRKSVKQGTSTATSAPSMPTCTYPTHLKSSQGHLEKTKRPSIMHQTFWSMLWRIANLLLVFGTSSAHIITVFFRHPLHSVTISSLHQAPHLSRTSTPASSRCDHAA